MKNKRATTDALEIMNARWGKEPGWNRLVGEERQKRILGDLIRQVREAQGLTQTELARLAKTTQSAISRLEDADYTTMKLETLRKVAAALSQPLIIGIGKKTVRIPAEKVRV
jgi:DNA-binding XRE family transcriptional regulator